LFGGCQIDPPAGWGQIEDVTTLNTEQIHRMDNLIIIKPHDLANVSYKSLGKIKGLSCASGVGRGDYTKEEAIDQLMIKAAKLEANAITNPICQETKTLDVGNNCWGSIKCLSEAIYTETPK